MALKRLFLTIVRGVKKSGSCELRSVPRKNVLHSSLYCDVVALFDDVVFGIRGVEPCLKTSDLNDE